MSRTTSRRPISNSAILPSTVASVRPRWSVKPMAQLPPGRSPTRAPSHHLSFFFYVHMDLFEEACKFRAGRRIWAKLLRERYGVKDEKALHFRFGVVCGGSSLLAAQPYN